MPDYHFINHRIEITSHDEDYQKVTVSEIAEANYSPLPEINEAMWRLQWKAKTTTMKYAFTQDYYIALTCTWTIRGFRDFLGTSSNLGFTFVKKELVSFFAGLYYNFDSLVTLTDVALDKYK